MNTLVHCKTWNSAALLKFILFEHLKEMESPELTN